MAKNRKTFCVECGAENEMCAKRCHKCHKNPDPKDHAWKDYISSKLTGGVGDGLLKMITRFLKKHLYGVLMSCSVLFTGAAFLTNIVFTGSHIERVTSRPTIKYLGEGLNAEELLTKYVDAVKGEDWVTVYGLQLEKTRPDIYKEIITMSDNSSPGFGEKKPIKVHTLTQFAEIYFRDGRTYKLSEPDDDVHFGKYGDYDYWRYDVYIEELEILDQIEIISVDGNYYVVGEKHHYEQMNLSQIIERGIIYNAGGDLSKIEDYDIDDPNLCGEVEDCLSKFGGMEVPQEW